MIDISVHNITNIAIDTPSVDDHWIQFTIKNRRVDRDWETY